MQPNQPDPQDQPGQIPQEPVEPSATSASEEPIVLYEATAPVQPVAPAQPLQPTQPAQPYATPVQSPQALAPQPAAPTPAAPEPYTPPAYTPTQVYGPAQQTAPPQWQPQAPPQQYVQYGEQGPVIMGAAGNNGSPGFTTLPEPKGKKKLFIIAGGAIMALLIVTGTVFGLYLPNTPSNVFNTGINRSGEAINGVVTASTTPQKLATYKTSEISGNITANFDNGTYAGDFDTKFDQSSLNGGLNFTVKDTSGGSSTAAKTLSAKVISQIASGNSLPDIYFQLNGLKELGLDSELPGISDYDGQWILIGSDYLKSIGATYLSGASTDKSQMTSNDIAELARTASLVTADYVFSTDKNTAVLTEKKFDGKEKVDGLNTYHYTVGINLSHAKAYCTALTNSLLSTEAYKKISGASASDISASKQSTAKSCSDSVNSGFKSSDNLDMWVDAKYKLIHKIRAYDTSDKGSYIEIGQVYTGGSNLSLFANAHEVSSKVDASVTLNTNTQTNATKGTITVTSTSKDEPGSLKITLSSKTLSAPVTVTKPANPVKIQDILTKLGLSTGTDTSSSAPPSGTLDNSDADGLRQADLENIQAELEAYFQTSGNYPTLANLNNASWRSANMPGFDDAALQDPSGTTKTLALTASKGQYGYGPTDCDATNNNCASYTLTAIESDGSTFSEENLD